MMYSFFSRRALFLELPLLALLAAATTAADSKFYLVCGKGTGCGEGNERKADAAEQHEVRCCSDTFVDFWSKRASCLVWAASDLDGCHKESHAAAAQRCAGAGGRLCTREELAALCTRGSGCQFDHALVWSSSPVVGDYQQELQELREDLQDQGEDLQEQGDTLREQGEQCAQHGEELQQQEGVLEGLREELRDQGEVVSEQEGVLEGLREELRDQGEVVSEQEGVLEGLREELRDQGEVVSEQEGVLEGLREELRVHEGALEDLRVQQEDKQEDQDAELQDVRAQLQELLALVVQDRCLCTGLPSGAPSLVPSGSPSGGPSCTPATCEWNQIGADLDGEASGDWSGRSIAVSGDGLTLAVGARGNRGTGIRAGHVRVYKLDLPTMSWIQMGGDVDGEASGDYSGRSVALSYDGAILAVGAPNNSDTGPQAGHVRVYHFDAIAVTWAQMGEDVDGEASGDGSGVSVALSGNGATLAVGAHSNDGTGPDAGHVRVFRFDVMTTSWIQMGVDVDGEASGDRSGHSVALSNDGATLAVGAPYNDGTGSQAGHVRVFRLNAVTEIWTQIGEDVDGETSSSESGRSVALSHDGAILAVGAPYNDGGASGAGHVRVFQFDGITAIWTQLGEDVDGEASWDRSGYSVALSDDGGTLAVGASYNDGTGSDAGHVRVYQYTDTTNTWTQMGADVDAEASGDRGYLLALSGDGATLAVGAPGNDGTGDCAGHVRVYGWAKKL